MGDAPETVGFTVGESFARTLTETTQSLVCVFDREGRILLFNEACERATGFSQEAVLGRDARDLVIPPEERAAFEEFLAYVWETGVQSPQVGHWQTRDGGRRLIAWSNRLMPASDGAPASLVTTGIDLTDRAPVAESGERALEGDPAAKLAEIGQLATEQRALRRVATLVAAEAGSENVFRAVSEECARVLEVNASAVVRYEGDGTALIVGRHNRDSADVFRLGESLPAGERSAVGLVLRTGRPARIDDWGADAADAAGLRTGYRSTAAAPIVVARAIWGAVGIASQDRLPPDSESRLGAFCELVSLAVASAQARADLVASRARVLRAGDEQRRRLERNLHDGAQQRFVSVALDLRMARARLESDPALVGQLLEEAVDELDAGLRELREIARGLHPAVLTDHGLARALEVLAARLPVEVAIEFEAVDRLPGDVEATAYYIVSEALTNVVRHAEASAARVTIARAGDVLRCTISDDGRGGADAGGGTGILGLRDRTEAAGGTLSVSSPRGGGTVVAAELPLGG